MSAKNKIEGFSQLKPSEMKPSEMIAVATDAISHFAENSEDKVSEMAEKSVAVIKKYPLHTAIATGVIGGAIGYFLKSSSNKKQ